MKDITLINFKFELSALYFLHEYIEEIGYNPTLYSGKSARKTYASESDYQVVCWQTKKHIFCEVVR